MFTYSFVPESHAQYFQTNAEVVAHPLIKVESKLDEGTALNSKKGIQVAW